MTHQHETLDAIISCSHPFCVSLLTPPRSNANPDGDPDGPLDVWLKFDHPEDEETSHEANVYFDRDSSSFRVEWYHTAVGQVSTKHFDTYRQATEWLESNGYLDFTVHED